MTRKEAIELLRELSNFVATPPETDEALNMAIEALEHDKKEIINMKSVFNLSDDLISRQAAIYALRAMQTYKLGAGEDMLLIDQAEAQTELMLLPSAQVEKAYELGKADRPKWIPCSERMPEEREWIGTEKFGTTISDKVLVTFESRGERFVKPMKFQNGELGGMDKHTMDAFFDEWKAVAWMPLPEAYREDGESE